MQVRRAGEEPHRGNAVAVPLDALARGRHDRRMVGEPELVVGAEIEDGAAARDMDLRGLRRVDDALMLVEPARLQLRQLGVEMGQETGSHIQYPTLEPRLLSC